MSPAAGGTRVSPSDYHELLTGTKFSPREINEWFVKFRADYPSGVIRKADFLALYKKLFPGVWRRLCFGVTRIVNCILSRSTSYHATCTLYKCTLA